MLLLSSLKLPISNQVKRVEMQSMSVFTINNRNQNWIIYNIGRTSGSAIASPYSQYTQFSIFLSEFLHHLVIKSSEARTSGTGKVIMIRSVSCLQYNFQDMTYYTLELPDIVYGKFLVFSENFNQMMKIDHAIVYQ